MPVEQLGRECHYCGGRPAPTKDHIVPRTRVRAHFGNGLPVINTVPACARCNQLKGHFRSDCDCGTCVAAWGTFLERVPMSTFRVMPVRALAAVVDGRADDFDAVIETLRLNFGSQGALRTAWRTTAEQRQ